MTATFISFQTFAVGSKSDAPELDAAVITAMNSLYKNHVQPFFGSQYKIVQSLKIVGSAGTLSTKFGLFQTPETFVSAGALPTYVQMNDYGDQVRISVSANSAVCIQLVAADGYNLSQMTQVFCKGTNGKASFNDNVEFDFSSIGKNPTDPGYENKKMIFSLQGNFEIIDLKNQITPQKFADMASAGDTNLGQWRQSYPAAMIVTAKNYDGTGLTPQGPKAKIYNQNGDTFLAVSQPEPCQSNASTQSSASQTGPYRNMIAYEAVAKISKDGSSIEIQQQKITKVENTRPGYCKKPTSYMYP